MNAIKQALRAMGANGIDVSSFFIFHGSRPAQAHPSVAAGAFFAVYNLDFLVARACPIFRTAGHTPICSWEDT